MDPSDQRNAGRRALAPRSRHEASASSSRRILVRCGRWSVEIDPLRDERLELSLEGPAFYVDFSVPDAGVLAQTARYLRDEGREESIALGTFSIGLEIEFAAHSPGVVLLVVFAGGEPRCVAHRIDGLDLVLLAALFELAAAELKKRPQTA